MNAARHPLPAAPGPNAPQSPSARPEQRHLYRDRDFGIGYGSSSGYGRDKRYVRDSGQALFRFK